MYHGRRWICYISSSHHLEVMLCDNIQNDQLVIKGLNTKEHVVSVMHTSLMAHSKGHVNVLTAVWLISVFSVYTYTRKLWFLLPFASVNYEATAGSMTQQSSLFKGSVREQLGTQGSVVKGQHEQGGSEQHVMVNQLIRNLYSKL